MARLTDGDCRCFDHGCPQRHQCARFMERNEGGPDRPLSRSMRGYEGGQGGECLNFVCVDAGEGEG